MPGPGEGHAFHNGAVQVPETVASAKTEELGAGVAVGAQPLSCQKGKEEQRICTRRSLGGLRNDLCIAECSLVKGASRPAHCIATAFEQNEGAPITIDCGDIADLGVEQRFLRNERQDERGAADVRDEPRPAGAGAQKSRRIVGCTDQDWSSLAKSGLARSQARLKPGQEGVGGLPLSAR